MRDNLQKQLDDILTYLELGQGLRVRYSGTTFEMPPLSYFNNAEFCFGDRLGDLAGDIDAVDKTLIMDLRPSDVPSLDVCTIAECDSFSEVLGKPLLNLQRLKRVSPAVLRPYGVSFVPPAVFTKKLVAMGDDGRYFGGTFVYGWWKAFDWRQFKQGQWVHLPWSDDETEDDPESIEAYWLQTSLAVFAKRPYEWHVRIGYSTDRMVVFSTDSLGAREFFRLREIPAGTTRRAALLHWVSGHWRKKRAAAGESSEVREHLRGKTDFSWGGLRCQVVPSADEAKRGRWAGKDLCL